MVFMFHPILLIILDGFGVSSEKSGNPVAEARTPILDEIEKHFPFTTLQASGTAVGLPPREAGNSEVGHLTMGAGRVVYHHLPRIISSIYDGSFFETEAFLKAVDHVRKNNSSLHIAGLVSSGSVHSYIDHLYALLDLAKKKNIERVFIHVFSDGKDAPPKEGADFLEKLGERLKKEWPMASLTSVVGRFYALDRDEKWDRVQVAYELLTQGGGEKIISVSEYLHQSYAKGETDEFVKPAVVIDEKGQAVGLIKANDALIFSDFREDSMREVTRVFAEEDFTHFTRPKIPNLLLVTMTEYQKGLNTLVAFPRLDISWPLARVLGEAGMSHLHIAETQKYAHVTYFFNGGLEKSFPGEERILIPSVAVSRFDEVPEMRAGEITEKILENFGKQDIIIANFANADMVGHSGNFQAAVQAVEVLDGALGQIMNAVLAGSGVMVVTADHGNIERKRALISGERLTEHSMNPVPFYLIGQKFRRPLPRTGEEIIKHKSEIGGILIDVTPTILELLDLKKPSEMTGQSLLDVLTKT